MSPESATASESAFWKSIQRAQAAVHALSLILGPLPNPLAFSDNPALSLLHDPNTAAEISRRLRLPTAGAGNDDLCRWLYDTFQSTDPALQLAVLRFVPTIAGVYLPRAASRKPLAGFEAVLLALYAHETVARAGAPLTATIPNLANPSIYHEARSPAKNIAAEDQIVAILSPALEPHGTVRSTRRARIVGVALELYYSKISQMPTSSKLEFCGFCIAWSGQDRILGAEEEEESCEGSDRNGEERGETGGRISLPWELFQPVLRIVGHCLLGGSSECEKLRAAAMAAVRCLHARAMHEMCPRAVLASRSLLRLGCMDPDRVWEQTGFGVASDPPPELESARISI